jgi:hypothetical protein
MIDKGGPGEGKQIMMFYRQQKMRQHGRDKIKRL